MAYATTAGKVEEKREMKMRYAEQCHKKYKTPLILRRKKPPILGSQLTPTYARAHKTKRHKTHKTKTKHKKTHDKNKTQDDKLTSQRYLKLRCLNK